MFGIICEEVGNIGRFLPVGEFGIDNAAEKFTELLHPLVVIEFAVDEVNLRHFRISISESARPILMAKRACLLSASGSSFGSVPCRQIGRSSGRERGCRSVLISGVAASLEKKNTNMW